MVVGGIITVKHENAIPGKNNLNFLDLDVVKLINREKKTINFI